MDFRRLRVVEGERWDNRKFEREPPSTPVTTEGKGFRKRWFSPMTQLETPASSLRLGSAGFVRALFHRNLAVRGERACHLITIL